MHYIMLQLHNKLYFQFSSDNNPKMMCTLTAIRTTLCTNCETRAAPAGCQKLRQHITRLLDGREKRDETARVQKNIRREQIAYSMNKKNPETFTNTAAQYVELCVARARVRQQHHHHQQQQPAFARLRRIDRYRTHATTAPCARTSPHLFRHRARRSGVL